MTIASEPSRPAPTRWGQQTRRDDPDDARLALIAAAARCIEANGVDATRIDDIAREAKVSRPTVYKYFPNRDAVVFGLVLVRTQRLYAELETLIARDNASFNETLAAIVERCVAAVRSDRVLNDIYGPGSTTSALNFAANTAVWTADVTRLLDPLVRRARAAGELPRQARTADAAQWLLRLITGFLLTATPTSADPAAERRLLRQFLATN